MTPSCRSTSLLRPVSAVVAILGLCSVLGACQSGDGLGVGAPAPAARAGSLADGPLPAMMPTSTSVGAAGTGPAGQNAAIGDGTAVLGGR